MSELLLKRWTAGWTVLVFVELASLLFERAEVMGVATFLLACMVAFDWFLSIGGVKPLEPMLLASPVGLEILMIMVAEFFAWRYIQLAPMILIVPLVASAILFWPRSLADIDWEKPKALLVGLTALVLSILWTATIFGVLSPMAWLRPEALVVGMIFPVLFGLSHVRTRMSAKVWVIRPE